MYVTFQRLLENPRSQITYLYMNHPVGFGCDVHLLASAFLNLTELHLAAVTKNPSKFFKILNIKYHNKDLITDSRE